MNTLVYLTTLVIMNLSYLFVISVLLRQLNRERGERQEMMERYRELALRVRGAQLRDEEAEYRKHSPWARLFGDESMEDVMGPQRTGESTTTQEEGRDALG